MFDPTMNKRMRSEMVVKRIFSKIRTLGSGRAGGLGLVLAAALCIGLFCGSARAQTQLSRGHQILLKKGLQIQAQVFPVIENTKQVVGFNLQRWRESNFTTVNLQWNSTASAYLGPAPGIPWGRYAGPYPLTSEELPYLPNMVSFQLSDEQDLSKGDSLQAAAKWLEMARQRYPEVLSYTNQWGTQNSVSFLKHYLAVAKPDMVMFDTYPFQDKVEGVHRSPTDFYQVMQKYRSLGLGGHDGTGHRPIPYGLYLETFGHPLSDSQMRLNQFSAWAFGYTFVSAFTYNSAVSSGKDGILFQGLDDSQPTPLFSKIAEINRQSRNLGPALVRLLSTDIRFVPGQYKAATGQPAANPVPSGIMAWKPDAGKYITAISAKNLGPKNDGDKGDVLVGYFKPLLESSDSTGPKDEIYFMIVNGLTDRALDADVLQRIHLRFDFGGSGINSLQRLAGDSGKVEIVPLIHDSGSAYHLDLVLDGGAGDLFKFNTGAPFVSEGVAVDKTKR
jgi:hypothetical protein